MEPLLYLGIFLAGVLVGVLIGWVILAPFIKQVENINKEKKALEEFTRCVNAGEIDRLFILAATEVGADGEEFPRLQALFTNHHNSQLLAHWRATKRFTAFSFLEFDRRKTVHNAAVVMSAGLEQKFRERDTRKSKGGARTRYALEPDNLLIGLQTALTAREDIKKGLMTQMTMAPPPSADEDDE